MIARFDGLELDSPSLALHALRELLEGGGQRVVVLRDGVETPLRVRARRRV